MAVDDEEAIQQLLADLEAAWNRADARAFGERYRPDGTLTNVNGSFFAGREAFNARHEEIFNGFLRGTAIEMRPRSLRFVRPDVAVLDADLRMSQLNTPPPRAHVDPDGTVHTSLLLVLVKEDGEWWITAFHNMWQLEGHGPIQSQPG